MPKVDTTLAQLSGATLFSKLDSGFWQIPLAKESKLLTTFITQRFCFNKLPFGISSAPEIFQCHMNNRSSRGILCHVDDILVYGKDSTEHEYRLQATLKRIQAAGITLNESKCRFYQSCVSFLGHVIDKHGISPDPKKTTATYTWDETTNLCYRTQKIYGDDQPDEQILPKHCTHLKVIP